MARPRRTMNKLGITPGVKSAAGQRTSALASTPAGHSWHRLLSSFRKRTSHDGVHTFDQPGCFSARPTASRNPLPGLVVIVLIAALCSLVDVRLAAAEPPGAITFASSSDRVDIFAGGQPFATYVFDDDKISRPYFCNLHAPCGTLVTRPLPPGPGDLDDHPQMHPGLWLAFGDLNGQDNWRLKARVKHGEFVEEPHTSNGRGTFAVRNRYLTVAGDRVICEEVCRYTCLATPTATILRWDSTFTPGEEPLVFGDQEEMGLGVRMATAIAESSDQDGLLTNSKGQTTAGDVWGQPAAWCDYSGVVDGKPVGITIAGHPDNFRASWWHARDYGLMLANPFGRAAMKQGPPSRVVVKPEESLQLRFAVIVHNGRPGAGYEPTTVINQIEATP